MAYTLLDLPNAPDPLRHFVDDTIEKYLRELHYLLALPCPKDSQPKQFQISIANMLVAVISGAAAVLTTLDLPPGRQFVQVLLQHYPWADDAPTGGTPRQAAHVLYNVYRIPLVHTGFALKKRARTIKTGRHIQNTLDAAAWESAVEALENSRTRPSHDPSVVIRKDATVLWLDPLYWGVRQMIQRSLDDPAQCNRVLDRIASGEALRHR